LFIWTISLLKMKEVAKKLLRNAPPDGSALILTVVLTSLLAIVGVLFVMASRVDKMATSAISENKELNLAAETVVTRISQELASDVPGVAGQEYYDYPDANDIWLAALEPYTSGGKYYWRQISNLYNRTDPNVGLQAVTVPDYQNASIMGEGVAADADGDGVADSRWTIIPEMSSSKGKPVYAAVRIIDNGAMLNANTAFKFDPSDPNTPVTEIGGSSQMQINFMALAGRPGQPPAATQETDLLLARANSGIGVDAMDLHEYEKNVIWDYGEPNGPYTPFDISDELEFRYRFLLNHNDIDTRLEQWTSQFRNYTISTPVDSAGTELDAWFRRARNDGVYDPNYAYRHVVTTHNMDRIITPLGSAKQYSPYLEYGKMVNVNAAGAGTISPAIVEALRQNDPNALRAAGLADTLAVARLAAQLAVNIVDLRDDDANVEFWPFGNPYDDTVSNCHGFEAQPFISEVAFRISETDADTATNNHFAIELYNPFDVDIPLGDFKLELRDAGGTVVHTISLAGYAIADGSRFVITSGSAASSTFGVTGLMSTGGGKEDSGLLLATYEKVADSDPPEYTLAKKYSIFLLRHVLAQMEPDPKYIYLDTQLTEDTWFGWDTVKNTPQFYARADNNWNIVYQHLQAAGNTLGSTNGLIGTRKNYNLATSVGPFVSIGDIARVLTVGPSTDPNDMIGVILDSEPPEELVRFDLRNPIFAGIFQYLTVLDPTEHGRPAYETRIKGRINVNTAPWFVIAQLPWMEPAIAERIVAYRETIVGAFESIADLMQVPEMGYYAYDPAYASADLDRFPDLTPSDGAVSDFEERDVIFSRISNLVTVRSDVFAAYILVRIGTDGPQKRIVAILDRSQVTSSADKVRILAFHPVSDPR